MTKQNKKDLGVQPHFQILTVKEKNKKLSFTGYWVIPEEVSIRLESKEKPKIPKFPKIPNPPRPPKYILPPCKSELESLMDEMTGDGRKGREDWCNIIKAKLDRVGMEWIDHDDFY